MICSEAKIMRSRGTLRCFSARSLNTRSLDSAARPLRTSSSARDDTSVVHLKNRPPPPCHPERSVIEAKRKLCAVESGVCDDLTSGLWVFQIHQIGINFINGPLHSLLVSDIKEKPSRASVASRVFESLVLGPASKVVDQQEASLKSWNRPRPRGFTFGDRVPRRV